MHSRTKAAVCEEQIREMINIAGLGEVKGYTELGGGEFNAAFKVQTQKGRFVLKIGPNDGANMLKYERGIMDVEIWAYGMLAEHTTVPVPKLYHSGREVVGNQWFVMDEINGKLLSEAKPPKDADRLVMRQIGMKIAEMHKITNDKFGYIQMGLHSTWKDAYYDMILALVEDADEQGNTLPGLAEILRYIRKYEYALDTALTPRLVHYDMFRNNIFVDDNLNFCGLIDTERSFWGDQYSDFLAFDLLSDFRENTGFIEGYNEISEEKIVFTLETRARMSLMRIYIALIMFTEGTTRLALNDPFHWHRKFYASQVVDYALHELERP